MGRLWEPVIIAGGTGLGLVAGGGPQQVGLEAVVQLCGTQRLGHAAVIVGTNGTLADSAQHGSGSPMLAREMTLRQLLTDMRQRDSGVAVAGWPVQTCSALAQRITQPDFAHPILSEDNISWQQPLLHVNPPGR